MSAYVTVRHGADKGVGSFPTVEDAAQYGKHLQSIDETVSHVEVSDRALLTSSQAAEMLDRYAEHRLEYLHVPEPQHSGDIEKMTRNDLAIWAEAQGVRKAAELLRNPHQVPASLPSWHWDAWADRMEELLGEKVERI